MTQDQYSQVTGDETEEFSDEDKPMTRFQRVASALRGDKEDPDTDVQDRPAAPQGYTDGPVTDPNSTATDPNGTVPDPNGTVADPNGTVADPNGTISDPNGTISDPNGTISDPNGTIADPNGMTPGQAGHPGTTPSATHPDRAGAASARQGDYWDTPAPPATGQDQMAAVTSPDLPVTDTDAAQDPTASQPDVDGTGVRAEDVRAEDQAGTETIPDVPVRQTPDGAEAPGGMGRHTGAAAQDLRPGDATGSLDNLGDLAYGKLIPDAADFTEQWQQIQFKFVDDPHASVTEAAEVVAQVTARMEAAIQERQRAIEERQRAIQEQQRSLRGRWGEDAQADTETLRETLRMYRAFLDQLTGSNA
jgi:hypothetical protein